MKDILENMMGFLYSLSMGDYFFFIGTFLLIVLFLYIIYLIKCSDLEEDNPNVVDDFDLEAVTKDIEKNYKPEPIRLTSYEEEQENNAIISYEELIQNKNKLGIGYDEDYIQDTPIPVKKFDLDSTAEINLEETKLEVRLMSYDKEEEFLKALKELQKSLS